MFGQTIQLNPCGFSLVELKSVRRNKTDASQRSLTNDQTQRINLAVTRQKEEKSSKKPNTSHVPLPITSHVPLPITSHVPLPNKKILLAKPNELFPKTPNRPTKTSTLPSSYQFFNIKRLALVALALTIGGSYLAVLPAACNDMEYLASLTHSYNPFLSKLADANLNMMIPMCRDGFDCTQKEKLRYQNLNNNWNKKCWFWCNDRYWLAEEYLKCTP